MTLSAELINVSVTFRHTESTDALKQYTVQKVENVLNKYVSTPTDAHIILSIEKREHSAEAVIRSQRYNVSAKEVSDDLYSAIDKVCDTVVAQLRKQKEKRTDHRV